MTANSQETSILATPRIENRIDNYKAKVKMSLAKISSVPYGRFSLASATLHGRKSETCNTMLEHKTNTPLAQFDQSDVKYNTMQQLNSPRATGSTSVVFKGRTKSVIQQPPPSIIETIASIKLQAMK
jgi:hypothetical protein